MVRPGVGGHVLGAGTGDGGALRRPAVIDRRYISLADLCPAVAALLGGFEVEGRGEFALRLPAEVGAGVCSAGLAL
jgi:hypothetical protein